MKYRSSRSAAWLNLSCSPVISPRAVFSAATVPNLVQKVINGCSIPARRGINLKWRSPTGLKALPPCGDLPLGGLDLSLEVRGRIDGLYASAVPVIIEEIKTTTLSLELVHEQHNPLHWAQAQCYAFMVAHQQNLSEVEHSPDLLSPGQPDRKNLSTPIYFHRAGDLF